MSFAPELGQAVFGQQSWQEHEATWPTTGAISAMADLFDILAPHDSANPFSNSAGEFRGEHLHVEAYSWDDSYEQPYNLAWRDFRASWYKHANRGLSVNRQLSQPETRELVTDFLNDMRTFYEKEPHMTTTNSGHIGGPQTTLTDRLHELAQEQDELSHDCDCPPEATANFRYAQTCRDAIAEIERLRAALHQPDPLGDALNSGDGSYKP